MALFIDKNTDHYFLSNCFQETNWPLNVTIQSIDIAFKSETKLNELLETLPAVVFQKNDNICHILCSSATCDSDHPKRFCITQPGISRGSYGLVSRVKILQSKSSLVRSSEFIFKESLITTFKRTKKFMLEMVVNSILSCYTSSVSSVVMPLQLKRNNQITFGLLQENVHFRLFDIIEDGYLNTITGVHTVLIQLSKVLQDLSELSFMHRDLHPGNIMFNQEYQVQLIDFGRVYMNVENKFVVNLIADTKTSFMPIEFDSSFDLAYFALTFLWRFFSPKFSLKISNLFFKICAFLCCGSFLYESMEEFLTLNKYTKKTKKYLKKFMLEVSKTLLKRSPRQKQKSTPTYVINMMRELHQKPSMFDAMSKDLMAIEKLFEFNIENNDSQEMTFIV